MATPQHHLGKTAGCEPDGISDGASRVATPPPGVAPPVRSLYVLRLMVLP